MKKYVIGAVALFAAGGICLSGISLVATNEPAKTETASEISISESKASYAVEEVMDNVAPTIESEVEVEAEPSSASQEIQTEQMTESQAAQVETREMPQEHVSESREKSSEAEEESITETFAEPTEKTEEAASPSFTLPTFMMIQGNVSDDFVQSVLDYYILIPEKIREHLQNYGMKIFISDEDLAKKFYPEGEYSSIQGITLFDTKEIWIQNKKTAPKETTIHECAHLLDESLGFVSLQEEWVNIYNAEKSAASNIMKNHAISAEEEYFAEAFAFYILGVEQLKETLPQTYAYIDAFVTNLN